MKRIALLALIACFAGAQFVGAASAGKPGKPAAASTSTSKKSVRDDGFSDGAR